MAKKFKLMKTIDWTNIDYDENSFLINLPPNSHTRNRGLQIYISDLWYEIYEWPSKTFSRKNTFNKTIRNLW